MKDIFSQPGAQMTKANCRYCKGSGYLEKHFGEPGGTMRLKRFRCRHVVGDPTGGKGFQFV